MQLLNWTLPAARRRPNYLGTEGGRFRARPNHPNSVNSQSSGGADSIEPLPYADETAEARRRLIEVLDADPDATIVTVADDYIHAEYRAFVFVDDVEFHFPADRSVVDVRSSSRVGRSDLGANRRRVGKIAQRFAEHL